MDYLETTIDKLKIGSKLVLGRYSRNVTKEPEPIVWLKGNRENEFISEFVLDSCQYDNGMNFSDYEHSDIFLFMNSDVDHWCDRTTSIPDNYHHYGFLTHFEDEEKDVLIGSINLPTVDDIFNGGLSLFNRKGRRAYCSDEYYGRFVVKSYISYWFAAERNTDYAPIITSDGGYAVNKPKRWSYGFRPKCKVDGKTKVFLNDAGIYELIYFGSEYQPSIFNEEELLELFGL